MSEAKEKVGKIEAISKTDKGVGFKVDDEWYNSTKNTVDAMGNDFEKGDCVTIKFLENTADKGKTYRNVIEVAHTDTGTLHEETVEQRRRR